MMDSTPVSMGMMRHFRDVEETKKLMLRDTCRPQEFPTNSKGKKYKVETEAKHDSANVEKQKTQNWGSFSANWLSSQGFSQA